MGYQTVNTRMSKPIENFRRVCVSQIEGVPGSNISMVCQDAPDNGSFAVLFTHLELNEGTLGRLHEIHWK